ncbi:MAG: outer membrane beta-barrel protein [Bacteroidota bacterium]
MKTFKKLCFLICFGLFATATAEAQRLKFALNYNVAVPMSESFKDYVSKTSLRGMQGAILYSFNEQIRAGLQVSYNDFYEKFPRQVYKGSDGSDISTVLTNTLQTLPIMVKGEYSFMKEARVQPYVGVGAGVNIVNFEQYLGEFPYAKYYTKAAFTVDVGILVPFRKEGNSGFRLSTSYNYLPFNDEGIKNLNSWNVQAGVVIPLK